MRATMSIKSRLSTAFSAMLLAALLTASTPAKAQETVDGVTNYGSVSDAASGTGTGSAAAQSVMLFKSGPYEAGSTSEQHFAGNMTLKHLQDQLPLFMSIHNGPEDKTPFKWFRVNIAGYLMASEKDLNGSRTAMLNVSGKVQPGGGQILIDGAGEPGATLMFTLSTPAISLTSAEPTEARVGKKIILNGQNFSSDERQDTVLIGGRPVPVLSAGPTSITALIPPNAPAGATTAQVVVDSVESATVPITVISVPRPVMTSMDFWMAPPGATLTISGQNFAANPSDNHVYFSKTPAQVVSSSENSLSVIVPNWKYGNSELNIPVCVVSNGVRSANAIRFDIGPKYLGALPPNPGDSYSEATSQASSQATFQASSQATSQASSDATVHGTSQATDGSYQEGPRLQFNNYKP